MAYTLLDVAAGQVDLYNVDTLGPGPLVGLGGIQPTSRGFANYPGTVMRGFDPWLGAGEFVFAKASGTIAYGTVCQLSTSVTNGRTDVTATAWAGTVNTGIPLGVALQSATVGQFVWYQVQGLAITTCSGAPAVGNPAYWQAAGVVSPTLVASKQAVNAVFASAAAAVIGTGAASLIAYAPGNTAGTLSATQALVLLNRPFAQGNIT